MSDAYEIHAQLTYVVRVAAESEKEALEKVRNWPADMYARGTIGECLGVGDWEIVDVHKPKPPSH